MLSAYRVLLRGTQSQCVGISQKVERIACIHVDVSRRPVLNKRKLRHSTLLKNQTIPYLSCALRFSSTNPLSAESLAIVEESTNTVSTVAATLTDAAQVQNENVNITSIEILDPIPEPPVPEPTVEAIINTVAGEPTFASIGLGGWGPVGIIQNCFEFLHISCSLPWWTSIVIGTIVVRVLMFPLVIAAQRNAAKMNNNLPQMQVLQLKMSEARERGDRLDSARYAQEMMLFMKEKNLNPLKNMLVPLAQAPLFISFFMGLREMSNLPVDSLKQGGLFWFTDLTVPDEFYLLPLITSATLALTIELGTDTARLQSANLGLMKYFLRAVPFVVFPLTLNFSSCILVYWVSSNFISLLQVSFLRIPTVRDYFKIEKMLVHDKANLPIKDKGFVKGISDSWTNMKLTKELEDRHRVDEVSFMRAGRGPVKKTYKYDPTKPTPPRTVPVHAKKRD